MNKIIISCNALPSHNVALTPLRGKLQAEFKSKPAAGPPLSVVNTITELLYNLWVWSALMTYTYRENSAVKING